MGYEIRLKGKDVELVDGADDYAQEGTLTTFFQGRNGRPVLDSWAKRLASYRTGDITRIRWLADAEGQGGLRPISAAELQAG